jgi:hypothetical protein
MFARVALFEGVNVEAAMGSMDEAVAVVKPMMEALPGFEGSMELMTPDGKFLSINFFDTEENVKAAEPTFDQEMPEKLGHLFEEWAGNRTMVDHFEVMYDSRDEG